MTNINTRLVDHIDAVSRDHYLVFATLVLVELVHKFEIIHWELLTLHGLQPLI